MSAEQIEVEDVYAGLELHKIWGSAMYGFDYPIGISRKQLFFIAAAAAGISTPKGLYKYYLKKTEEGSPKGHEWMTDRLVRVNELTQHVWATAGIVNPKLGNKLKLSYPRSNQELGEYEPDAVSIRYFRETPVPAPATAVGWAVPRMLIVWEDRVEGMKFEQSSFGQAFLEHSLAESNNPETFLCKFAESLFIIGNIKSGDLLGLMLKDTNLKEHNIPHMYGQVVEQMPKHSPKLFSEAEYMFKNRHKLEKIPDWMDIFVRLK